MLKREFIHSGAVSLPDVPRAEQIRLFNAVLDLIESTAPPLDLVRQACNQVRTAVLQAARPSVSE